MQNQSSSGLDRLGAIIGRSRYVVIIAVVAVIALSVSLFLLGTVSAVRTIVGAWTGLLMRGDTGGTELVVETLSIIGVMLRAVVFYIIGVGLYSLFIKPLNLTTALGMETLADLEAKVISVVVVMLAVRFLQQFMQWQQPVETAYFGLTMAAVIGALVLFQLNGRKAKEFAKQNSPDVAKRAQKEMFEEDKEHREIKPDEVQPGGAADANARQG
jgi:uncharacterized membrane protein YqhA